MTQETSNPNPSSVSGTILLEWRKNVEFQLATGNTQTFNLCFSMEILVKVGTPLASNVTHILDVDTNQPFAHEIPPLVLAGLLTRFADEYFPIIKQDIRSDKTTGIITDAELVAAEKSNPESTPDSDLSRVFQAIDTIGTLIEKLENSPEESTAETPAVASSIPTPTHPAPKGTH